MEMICNPNATLTDNLATRTCITMLQPLRTKGDGTPGHDCHMQITKVISPQTLPKHGPWSKPSNKKCVYAPTETTELIKRFGTNMIDIMSDKSHSLLDLIKQK